MAGLVCSLLPIRPPIDIDGREPTGQAPGESGEKTISVEPR